MSTHDAPSERDLLVDLGANVARLVEIFERAYGADDETNRQGLHMKSSRERAALRAQSVAEEYLRALASGDAVTANRLGRVNAEWPVNDLLRQEVYERAEHLTEPRIISADSTSVTQPHSEVRCVISYHLAGETVRDNVTVTRDSDDWWISRGLTCPPPRRHGSRTGFSTQYSVRGSRFGIESSRHAGQSAYVGVYTVTPPNQFYVIDGDVRAVLLGRDRSFFGDDSFRVIPDEGYVSLVQAAVDQAFADMTSRGTLDALREAGMRTSFGLALPGSARVAAIAVLEPPVVTIGDSEYREFTVSDARVLVSARGENAYRVDVTEDIVGRFCFSVETSTSAQGASITVRR